MNKEPIILITELKTIEKVLSANFSARISGFWNFDNSFIYGLPYIIKSLSKNSIKGIKAGNI